MADYDIIGNIAIIRTEEKTRKQKLELAKELLKRPAIKTILERQSHVKGRLRTIKTKHLAGKKNLIANYKENNCCFKFNIENCYFSPRLSGERKLIAEKIKSTDKVLVMFSGIAVYPIIIYKTSKPIKITAIELGRQCHKWAKENLKLNKIPKERIELIQGDVKKVITKKGLNVKGNLVPLPKYNIVVMARPNLKETFLAQGLQASKKSTLLIYYGFCNIDEIESLKKQLIAEAKSLKRKIKIQKIIKSGDIAPYKYRYRIEIKVLN